MNRQTPHRKSDGALLTALAAMAALLSVGSLGNVRSQTLRAYSADEIKKIIALMP